MSPLAVLPDQNGAVAVPAPLELLAECRRPLAELRSIGAGRLGDDCPQLALERDPLPGRARLQATDGLVIDVPDHDLGQHPLLTIDIDTISHIVSALPGSKDERVSLRGAGRDR